jgi:hypothetical protein
MVICPFEVTFALLSTIAPYRDQQVRIAETVLLDYDRAGHLRRDSFGVASGHVVEGGSSCRFIAAAAAMMLWLPICSIWTSKQKRPGVVGVCSSLDPPLSWGGDALLRNNELGGPLKMRELVSASSDRACAGGLVADGCGQRRDSGGGRGC